MTIWEKTKSVFYWVLGNAVIWATALAGIILKAPWAFHLFAFIVWLLTFVFFLIWSAISSSTGYPNQTRNELTTFLMSKERVVPAFIDIIVDLALIVIVVAFGHWFYGILLLTHVLLYESIYRQLEELKSLPS